MRIKSYFANSVNAAIREARQELGPEAMLIESRPAPDGARELGQYEVVFGLVEQSGEATGSRGATPPADDLTMEVKLLRTQIDELRRIMQPDAPVFSRSEADELRDELAAADVEPSIAAQLVEQASNEWNSPGIQNEAAPRASLREAVRACLQRRCTAEKMAAGAAGERHILVFVGPPGAGKSSSLAKIAIQRFLARQRSIRIVSVDSERAGSHERLRVLSGIAGLGFIAANSIAELAGAVEESVNKHDILIDTPGFGAADMDSAAELARALERLPRRDVHLVLPASMRRRDLEACAARFSIFKPDYVLATRLDETDSLGGLLSTALKIGKPLSFVCAGQSVPEDLEIPDIRKLARALLPDVKEQAATAA